MHFDNKAIVEVLTRCLNAIPLHYPAAKLDEFIIMPNHIHGIIWISEREDIRSKHHSLGHIIGSFKSAVSKSLHEESLIDGRIWQRNYFERIIGNEEELNSIRKYISENPLKWELDRENLANIPRRGQACLTPITTIKNIEESFYIKRKT